MDSAEQGRLVAAVRKHALDHYNEGGWDIVVEAYEDGDIIKAMGTSETPEQAIRAVGKRVRAQHGYRRDVQGEIF